MGGDPDDPSLARTSLERVAAVAFLPVPPNAWMGVWVPADFLMRFRAFGAGMTPVGGVLVLPAAKILQGTSYPAKAGI